MHQKPTGDSSKNALTPNHFFALIPGGLVLITFIILVLYPRNMDGGTLAIVRFLAAILAGLSAYLFTGTLKIEIRLPIGNIQAAGAFCAFVITLIIFFYGIPSGESFSTLPTPSPTLETPVASFSVGSDGRRMNQAYRRAYRQLGGVKTLGSPINHVESWEQPNGNGTLQHFEGGSEDEGVLIMPNSSDEVFWIGSSFWRVFRDSDATKGILVHPTGNSYGTNKGSRQNFKGGAILKAPQGKGTFAVWGGIGSHYLKTERGEIGRLGFPINRELGIGAGIHIQEFEAGSICYDENGTPTQTLMYSNACR
jgi:hypothetical protein